MSDSQKEKPDLSSVLQPISNGLLARTWGWFASKRPGPRVLVPVYARDTYQQRPSPSPLPWWSQFTAWLRYHSIQLRWDIERGLARLSGRRWR
ncbi:MAG TPA: hypothetical protein VKR06_15060 [Ktedonosporobacter sp.]|nr:hypothetical protein [Ktedonosporobacter sp.]